MFYLVRYAFTRIEAQGEYESSIKQSAAAAVLRKLDRPVEDDEEKTDDGPSRRSRKEDLVLNQYEQTVAMDVVAPEDIPVTFEGTYPSLFMLSHAHILDNPANKPQKTSAASAP